MQRGFSGQLRWSSVLPGRKERLPSGSEPWEREIFSLFLSSFIPHVYLLLQRGRASCSPGTSPHSPRAVPLRRRAGGAPTSRPHGFLFFLGPSREPRRKPALYRDADTTLLGVVKAIEGKKRGWPCGQAKAAGVTGHDFNSKLNIKTTYFHWISGWGKT